MLETSKDRKCARQRRLKNLERLMRPRHIAFIGGTQATGAIEACRAGGFRGDIWAVNPMRDQIANVACVPNIESLPQAPDASLIALSPERSVEAVKALAQIGAGGAVCMSGGVAEMGAAGSELQARLKSVAQDLAVLGPNCMGVLNLFDGAAIWGTNNHVERPGERGAAIVSQSGAFLYGITNVEQAFPLGYAVSTGNQAIIEAADCIETLLEDDRVRAIGLYLEGLEDGNALGAACLRALTKGVPIVALKGGDSPAGEAVAIGHTGAMVVESDIWRAFCHRYGIVELSSPKAMVEALKFLTVAGVPKGNRLSAVTYSGGLNSLIAGGAPALGLALMQPTEKNASALRKKMPDSVRVANPLDLNVPFRSKTEISMENGQLIGEGICDLARQVADMAVFFIDVPRADEKGLHDDWLPAIESMVQVKDRLRIPCAVAGILPEGLELPIRHKLLDQGIAPLQGFGDAMEAISVAAKFSALHSKIHFHGQLPERLHLHSIEIGNTEGKMLNEEASKLLLKGFGLKIPEGLSCPATKTGALARQLGFPVVLKILSDKIAHKAKMGWVYLNLKNESEVQAATQAILDVMPEVCEDGKEHQFLIERMVEHPIAEFIIGLKRHSSVGLALMIGRGGTGAEQLRQYATLLLPLEERSLDLAMEQLGYYEQSIGHASLRQAICAVAVLAEKYVDRLLELDVNPIILTTTGEAIAADAMVVLTS